MQGFFQTIVPIRNPIVRMRTHAHAVRSVKNICHEKKLFSTFGPLFKNHICPLYTSIGAWIRFHNPDLPSVSVFRPILFLSVFIFLSLSLSLRQIWRTSTFLFSSLFTIKPPPEITREK